MLRSHAANGGAAPALGQRPAGPRPPIRPRLGGPQLQQQQQMQLPAAAAWPAQPQQPLQQAWVCRAAAVEPPPQHVQLQQLSFAHRPGLYDSSGRLMLKNLTLPQLEEWAASIGEDVRRGMQLWRWMYYDGAWIASMRQTLGQQNGLSASFCDKVEPLASVDGGLLLQRVVPASDGTRKLVFTSTEGEAKGGSVEAVLIPMLHRRGSRNHITLCVSSQVGCAMNCQFCYTGRMGLSGNLSTAQIVEQMVVACRVLAQEADAGGSSSSSSVRGAAAITNIVFMGMGEPLHNYASVMAAINIMCHPLGLHMSHKKVTVSTVGLVDTLEVFAASSNVQLALSLHATTDAVRDWIVPVNRRHNLDSLVGVLRKHYGAGNPGRRRVLIEYTMLDGVNDGLEDAARLVDLLQGVEAKVNLICFNPWEGTRFNRSPMERVLAFRSVLIQAGRICTIRDSRGDDAAAACGQLGGLEMAARPAPILPPPPGFEDALLPPGPAEA